MKLGEGVKKNWWIAILILILLFSFYIRIFNIVPDRILSFDPTFYYRLTKYYADWGVLPQWDELSYYVGRSAMTYTAFMVYPTVILHWLFSPLGFSLLTTCAYASALYGALICIPAFFLIRELSNKYGGLIGAFLIGTAPQILIRTFGSSYDTDQLVLFFIVLTLYLSLYAMRKRTVSSFCLALIGFAAFMLTWGLFIYSLIILGAAVVAYAVISTVIPKGGIIKGGIELKNSMKERFSHAFAEFRKNVTLLVGLMVGLIATGFVMKTDAALLSFFQIFQFATKPEVSIVNISIAELQPFSIFNLDGWIMAMGRFVTGDGTLDLALFLVFTSLMIAGLYFAYKKDLWKGSFLLTVFIIGIYTTFRGIRFTEFTSALFIIIIAAGFGYFMEHCKKDDFLKIFAAGLGLCLIFVSGGIAMQIGQQLGPDINSNWDNAWAFLRTQTPELSIVGTWWDPGHMIAALAERRNYADGAHCSGSPNDPTGSECLYGINNRITDLGKIMATTDEATSLELINKYKGDSPKVYWIASDDLVGKFQWLQYFGLGCDARTNQNCPIYMQIPRSSVKYSDDGQMIGLYYQNILLTATNIPIPIYTQGKEGAVIKEVIMYDDQGNVHTLDLEPLNVTSGLKSMESQLGLKLQDDTLPLTLWIAKDYSMIVIIPSNLREAVFTKMFFLEGEGLKHFKQVFRNEQVKIYEVIF